MVPAFFTSSPLHYSAMTTLKNIHIGSLIKQKFNESSLTIWEFAAQIHYDRTTIYDIFKRKSIDVELLIRISQILNYNFIEEVYLKHNVIKPSNSTSVFIVIEIDKNTLPGLILPENFIHLLKE